MLQRGLGLGLDLGELLVVLRLEGRHGLLRLGEEAGELGLGLGELLLRLRLELLQSLLQRHELLLRALEVGLGAGELCAERLIGCLELAHLLLAAPD